MNIFYVGGRYFDGEGL